MKTQRWLVLALWAIALGLLLNAVGPLLHPGHVKAGGAFKCKGDFTVKAFGATESSIGGYDVKLACDD